MIARVIVNQSTKAPDVAYDYLIPENMEEEIIIGSRLKVPFGASNREVEGYVVDKKTLSSAKRLKSVISVYDRVFDEKMLEVIKWLREQCVCTYLDVIKTVVPRGSINKPLEWLELAGEEDNKITKLLKSLGGESELNTFLSHFDTDISKELKSLTEKGIIKKTYRDRRDVKGAYVRCCSSIVEEEKLSDTLSMLQKRAPIQARMLDILSCCDKVSLADLVRFSDGSYGAVRSLEKKELIKIFDVRVMRSPLKETERDEKKLLTDEQEKAFLEIKTGLKNGFLEFLLHGVTGSGKTEVFLHSIEECVNMGKKAIMLVPEISLTPQMVSRFSKRFGNRIAVLHSGLSLGERYDEWQRIQSGKADIVIGARSAIFAPLDNIGMIIIDEEHEQSYKSENNPRYNACEVAKFRAKQYGAVLVRASATPKLESYYDALSGKTKLLEIKKRISDNGMPLVSIVDMRLELENGNRSVLSEKLKLEIEKNLKNGEQTILFLNRRGYSTFVSCRSCGFVPKCPNCSISLTYHKSDDSLRCHYCGHSIKNYKKCPSCESTYIRYFGGGTQKVEEEIGKIFPDAKVMRMDNDTTSGKGGHERVLKEFERTKADILIGTQMVAKGLDFPNVTLVGVISADTSLFADDFRAAERTFDLLEQVTGRAGRAEKTGRAVIQTYSPLHEAIILAAKHDFNAFYNNEIKTRQAINYPPFCDMIAVGFSGANDAMTAECAKRFARQLSADTAPGGNVRLLGPIKAAVSKIKNKYRWQLIIKTKCGINMTKELAEAMKFCRKNKNYADIIITVDINPNTIF